VSTSPNTCSTTSLRSLWHENTPFTALEALNFGLPVLASRLGGLSEIVDDGKNGLLFDAGDAAQLVACLERLAAKPALLDSLSRATEVHSVLQDVKDLRRRYAGLMAQKEVEA
jgi:glycosyltransferase involved in cell wall biosynthesis